MVVHPAVEDRVDTGRAERHDAAEHVAELEETTADEIVSELGDHRVDMERRPGDREHRHDGRQHLVGSHAL